MRRLRVALPGSASGLVVAVLLLWLSLTPSLLPSGGVFQGVLSGASAVIGYGLGVGGAALIRVALARLPPERRRLTGRPGELVRSVAALRLQRYAWPVAGAGTVLALWVFWRWQRDLRDLMGMPGLPVLDLLILLVVAPLAFALLLALSRGVSAAVRVTFWWVARRLPARVATPIALVVVAALTLGLINGVLLRGLRSSLGDTFAAVNDETRADTAPPTVPERSGSPTSLVTWDSLGREGRIFVAGGPDAATLTDFNGSPARQPIRAYTGLASAESLTQEAALAVRELERAGGFERSVLAVATTTGTGWLNANSSAALEYLYNGDTAVVSMQYSYLPSWISFIVDKDRAQGAGRALFDAVHARWSVLPEATRPRLVVFGESLGSFGGEAAFSGVADLRSRTNGALFVGPASSNELWQEVVAGRDPGSPQWLPVYDQGRTVRFVARPSDLQRPATPWGERRVVYLQYPSDPITWWTPSLLWARPDWLTEPRGYDVLSGTRWVPLVTFLQLTADMAISTAVPDGHGHRFGADPADAWAAILTPSGWTPADTQRLRERLGDHSPASPDQGSTPSPGS